ncbi:hypothetical protein BDV29DRAFT_193685 [Aspergillus leporis]|uniref:FMN-dependent dehydrogenase domain-containing protein n=1 Tax=Aspergillus leporis TaxID=41062 RepID=A0A5N5WUJ4_9EURO|nr:hypothetical protein BDV29DRAFT_193685 [Aspergillus leporis]
MSNRAKELDSKILTIQYRGSEEKTYGCRATPSPRPSQYYNEGAGDMASLRDNTAAFTPYKLCPRVLRDVNDYPSPFGFAPASAHKSAHPDGELATSRAAAKNNIPIVDLPLLGNRLNQARNNFKFPEHMRLPVLAGNANEIGLEDTYEREYGKDKTIPWLRQNTKLEVWLKGVCAPEDVQLAIDYKLDGVIISNRGGRQLDGVPATPGKIPLAIDGSILRGSDVFNAIALGASMCYYDGENGFRRTMMFTGCKNISGISERHLTVLEHNGRLSKL